MRLSEITWSFGHQFETCIPPKFLKSTAATIMTRTTPSSQSLRPLPTPLAMSRAPADATASPIPLLASVSKDDNEQLTRPHPKPSMPTPKLLLKVTELTHEGARVFFKTTDPATVLSDAVTTVLQTLYNPLESQKTIPGTRSVTLILRPMDGVAYTQGSDLDEDHKEIHFSLDYIARYATATSKRQQDEIAGVLVHEMVHAWQWNALGTAPGGLVEGIADFVRLRAGLSPPHWKKEAGGDWDAGYQHTAYFLEWIEGQFGNGSVMRINEYLRRGKYVERSFWTGLFGETVEDLWMKYTKEFECTEELSNEFSITKAETSASEHKA